MESRVGEQVVSRETYDDLRAFADLVVKWTPKINLISKSTVSDVWGRHIVDSAQLYRFAPEKFDHWVDIGSGGGFPGIVMSIMAKTSNANAQFTLIESDQRKSTFLRTAARELKLRVDVLSERIEQAEPQEADIVSARALATLSALLPMASRHLSPSGVALLHKGRQTASEISEAQHSWSFDLEQHASYTDPEARLLIIQRILRVGN